MSVYSIISHWEFLPAVGSVGLCRTRAKKKSLFIKGKRMTEHHQWIIPANLNSAVWNSIQRMRRSDASGALFRHSSWDFQSTSKKRLEHFQYVRISSNYLLCIIIHQFSINFYQKLFFVSFPWSTIIYPRATANIFLFKLKFEKLKNFEKFWKIPFDFVYYSKHRRSIIFLQQKCWIIGIVRWNFPQKTHFLILLVKSRQGCVGSDMTRGIWSFDDCRFKFFAFMAVVND